MLGHALLETGVGVGAVQELLAGEPGAGADPVIIDDKRLRPGGLVAWWPVVLKSLIRHGNINDVRYV